MQKELKSMSPDTFHPTILKRGDWTLLRSSIYNYDFNRVTGVLARWGTTKDDDPIMSPVGPEIADIEIVTGSCSGGCPWCYKSNPKTPIKYMAFNTFARILNTLPSSLTQVALGITDLDANPDLISIMQYCRDKDIVPNITISGMGNLAPLDDVAMLCGAIAVSVYPHNKEQAYNVICYLTDFYPGLQVNVHLLYHRDNEPFVMGVIDDYHGDGRMAGINAIVLLGLKPKGRADDMTPLPTSSFEQIISYAMKGNVPVGMDSCSTPKFTSWMSHHPEESFGMGIFVESCESSLFSIYINIDGISYPCSFTEGLEGYPGVDMLSADDFIKDVWFSQPFREFRLSLICNDRSCPAYPEINE